jgi:hypothetical protein
VRQCKQVRIHKVDYPGFLWQKLARKGRFACAIRSGNDPARGDFNFDICSLLNSWLNELEIR